MFRTLSLHQNLNGSVCYPIFQLWMARVGEIKQGAREGLDRDPDSDLIHACAPCSGPTAQCLAGRRVFCVCFFFANYGAWGRRALWSLPKDLILPFVLRHREEIVLVSDSLLVRHQGLVCGVCMVWSVHVCACVSPHWPLWACVSASPPCSLLLTQTTFTFY